jgi:hypothetical protein
VLLAVAAAACGSSSGGGGGGSSGGSSSGSSGGGSVQLMAGFDPGPAPDPSQGFQIILPIVNDIPAASSQEYCSWTNMILPQDVWINASQGFQTETGHHVVLYYAPQPQPVATRLCANEDMAEFQFGMPTTSKGDKLALPGNLAVHLPAGAQIVVNHHYLNAGTTDVLQAQSALNVYYADPNVAHTESSTMAVLDSSLTVPAGASTFTVDCTFKQEFAAWDLIPHMHAWGTHITIQHTNSAGVHQLADMDWDPSYAFDLPSIETKKDPSAPYMFEPGDTMHIQCDYQNPTNAPMSFGTEMCLFVGFTVDSNGVGNIACDRGQWGPF